MKNLLPSLTRRWLQLPTRRIIFVTGVMLLYMLIFLPMYRVLGETVGVISVVPVMVAGGALGPWGGAAIGILGFVVHGFLFHIANPEMYPLFNVQGVFANTMFTLFGIGVGWVSNLYRRAERQKVELEKEIDEREQAEKALEESRQRYALALRGANDGLWDWDLEADTIFFSPRWKAMIGYEEDEIRSSPDEWFDRIHPEDRDQFEHDITTHLDGLTQQLVNEHRLLHKDGGYRWMLCRGVAVRNEDGTAHRMAGSLGDITRRKEAEQQLYHNAFYDALTDLANRDLFTDRLSQALERARRYPTHSFAVFFLDLDEFKMINDRFGHKAGDELLIAMAGRLRVCTRATDTVARLGGDEFAILAEEIQTEDDAIVLADRIQEEVQLPFTVSDHRVNTSVSIGIVIGDGSYDRPDDVLRDADIAMYGAKARGKAGAVVFDSGMRARVLSRLQLESDLRHALDEDQFSLHYQPVIALDSKAIIGFEALVRWEHPTRGQVSPAEFIPIAEETGFIVPLGEWVLREACRQMVVWNREYSDNAGLTISVNVSPHQFRQPDLVERVSAILEETGLLAEHLMLEITESVIMKDIELTRAHLDAFRELGIVVQMDDFGTGYSSLGYLNQFPIDTIKIDRSFVSSMEANRANREIVQTIVSLAQELGLDVIAEGIETDGQHIQLQQLGCRRGQGYYFSRPLDSSAAGSLLANTVHADEMDFIG